MISDFLDSWYTFFENWSFLERVIRSRLSFLFLLSPDHLLHHIGTLLLVSVACFLLSIILFHKRLAKAPWIPFACGACVGVSLLLMWLFTNQTWDEILVVFAEVKELFINLFTSFGIGSVLELLIGIPITLIHFLMLFTIFCLPLIPLIIAVYLDFSVYHLWGPIALLGDIGMGTLAIAAIVGGFFAMGMFLLVYVGPIALFIMGMIMS